MILTTHTLTLQLCIHVLINVYQRETYASMCPCVKQIMPTLQKSPHGRVGLQCTNVLIIRLCIIKQSYLF